MNCQDAQLLGIWNQESWSMTSSWWLENITDGLIFRWRSILIIWVWNTGQCFGRMATLKKPNLVLQIWVLSWKGSSSLSPSWRLLGRDQKGLHKGISRPVFGSELDYSGFTDLHHKLWWVQTCTQLPQGKTPYFFSKYFRWNEFQKV